MAYNQLNLIYEKREHNTTMTLHSFIFKVQNKFWAELVHYTKKTPFYLYIYRSYWHYLFSAKKEYNPTPGMYFAARPNPGAGIGHQMANWIAGYWWAKQLGLKFAHILVCPNILLTVSMGTPFASVVVVANVCLAR